MSHSFLFPEDIKMLEELEISQETLSAQIEFFKKERVFPKLISAASVPDTIQRISSELQSYYVNLYDSFVGTSVKFVPASGAATRMFKEIFELREALSKGVLTPKGEIFFKSIDRFPFYTNLQEICGNALHKLYRADGSSDYENMCLVVDSLLSPEGLNYGSLPKGLVSFHSYGPNDPLGSSRSAFIEQLVEGAKYLRSIENPEYINFHFTVSENFENTFRNICLSATPIIKHNFGKVPVVKFSVQKRSTDTIAVDHNFNPVRVKGGGLLFRPGGHGALLENLNQTEGDIIFVKNIDNVATESYLPDNVKWKKVLAGKLLEVREQIWKYLNLLDCERSEGLYEEIIDFMRSHLCIDIPNINREILGDYLRAKLDRPIRVCGMVLNEGEPGGGPFLVRDADGSTSLQILEQAQIDKNVPEYVDMFRKGTHFNPVDVVCTITRYNGERFDLNRFTDPETAFVSEKSFEGISILALELPGLWNGSMSNWNTVFVEVPSSTFTPVKTLFDLLRPEHA